MRVFNSLFTALLCAFALLAQQRADASEAYDRYSDIFSEAMDATVSVITVIAELTDETVTVEKVAKEISKQAAALREYKAQLISIAPELSEEDQERLNTEFEDPEVKEAFQELDKAIEAAFTLFEKESYYDSDELRAACEEFREAYQ